MCRLHLHINVVVSLPSCARKRAMDGRGFLCDLTVSGAVVGIGPTINLTSSSNNQPPYLRPLSDSCIKVRCVALVRTDRTGCRDQRFLALRDPGSLHGDAIPMCMTHSCTGGLTMIFLSEIQFTYDRRSLIPRLRFQHSRCEETTSNLYDFKGRLQEEGLLPHTVQGSPTMYRGTLSQ